MPLPIPQLDNRRFNELVTTLRDQIPGYTKEWTDFNPSDPGITLLELWCWLAEMVLYRIDRIPERSYTNFYKLILDPPEPVIAEVTLKIHPQIIPITIPKGTQFVTKLHSPLQVPERVLKIIEEGEIIIAEDGRLIFETFENVEIQPIPYSSPPSLSPPEFEKQEVPPFFVRSKVMVRNEKLGVSNGQADQIFNLGKEPVLIDELNTGTGPGIYNPNPRITVDGAIWEYVPDLLESGYSSTHFMVEQLTGRIRFGDGKNGQIPMTGAEIIAEQYQIIMGEEVKIDQNSLELLHDIPGLPQSEIEINNKPAEGGAYLYPREEMGSTGLRLFNETYRAITKEDFEELASTQFNQAQESDWIPESPSNRAARAVAVPGKNLEDTSPFPDQPGAISVIILPRPANSDDVVLQPTEELKDNVRRFLKRRSLITTRIYVVGPDYVDISLDIEVVRRPHNT